MESYQNNEQARVFALSIPKDSMAKFIGTAGDFMKEKAFKHRVDAIAAFFMAFVVVAFVIGWVSGFFFGHRNLWSLLSLLTVIGLSVPYFKFLGKKSSTPTSANPGKRRRALTASATS